MITTVKVIPTITVITVIMLITRNVVCSLCQRCVLAACSPPCGLNVVNSHPQLLAKSVDCPYDDQKTSSSLINAAFGQIPLECERC